MMTKTVMMTVTLALASAAGADIVKKPDLGNFWFPIDPNNGTYVYADSFVPDHDCTVTDLGMWLDDLGSGGSKIRFEVWGDTGGFGPDASNVLSSTGSVSPATNAGLAYNQYSASPANLIGGNTYWFAATVVGEKGPGFWQTGGHTQNSDGIIDNGTFWYSNDPSGISFDGQNLTPEIAYAVFCKVPTPGSAALLGLGGLIVTRRRRA
jgi:hypothetical protein